MTKHNLFAAGMLCLFCNLSLAQDAPEATATTSKLLDHRIGVQANELIRQVFNFNNSTNNTLNNPYLLTYSVTHAKTGLGIRLGIGPEFNNFKNDDGITQADNDIQRINARIGIQKVFKLSDRWSAGAGADFVYTNDETRTKTFVRTFDSTRTHLISKTKSTGYGAMAWLNYHITPRVHIGTETSFYYRTGNASQTLSVTRKVSSFPGSSTFETTTDKLDNDLKEGLFRLPMVFYLVIMF